MKQISWLSGLSATTRARAAARRRTSVLVRSPNGKRTGTNSACPRGERPSAWSFVWSEPRPSNRGALTRLCVQVTQAHMHADVLVPGFEQERGGEGAIHPTAHGDNDLLHSFQQPAFYLEE